MLAISGNTIALWSVIATGLVAVLTVAVNFLLQKRRLAHEKELHESRLVHERAEAVRTTAAEAYSKTVAALEHLTPKTIYTIANSREAEDGWRRAAQEAMDALGFVSALGWSEQVRESAEKVRDQLVMLANATWATVGGIRRKSDKAGAMVDQLTRQADETQAYIDRYREAVSD